MTGPPQTWLERVTRLVDELAGRRASLLALLLALNALARPYAGLVHDAQLYGLQVLNQLEPERYGDDLFLRFGSQDQYSLFSRALAPVVAFVGVPWTFFFVYLGCNALFFWALQRFIFSLIADRRWAAVSLIYLAVAGLPFGGLGV